MQVLDNGCIATALCPATQISVGFFYFLDITEKAYNSSNEKLLQVYVCGYE
jgi:hypothetical protein